MGEQNLLLPDSLETMRARPQYAHFGGLLLVSLTSKTKGPSPIDHGTCVCSAPLSMRAAIDTHKGEWPFNEKRRSTWRGEVAKGSTWLICAGRWGGALPNQRTLHVRMWPCKWSPQACSVRGAADVLFMLLKLTRSGAKQPKRNTLYFEKKAPFVYSV